VLKKALEDRIADLGKVGSWPEILADLDSLTETEVEQDNKRFLLRSAPRPARRRRCPATNCPSGSRGLIRVLQIPRNVVPSRFSSADFYARSMV
jgi:hypothetical protein